MPRCKTRSIAGAWFEGWFPLRITAGWVEPIAEKLHVWMLGQSELVSQLYVCVLAHRTAPLLRRASIATSEQISRDSHLIVKGANRVVDMWADA